ncbi:NAD(P)/FAD-dependent oxidoreductase [Galbibacter sp. EGI 63066]|uniref:NAD(P)/FAD-dependent oxidoreductase n=1 Tax=Galbibacter sp. EGI 63066 TaxID=2993559 RepID=UPI002248E10D|nr:NAD(P)/FAD-dependent oxidoreductase [Galbibacter sp. EGI 63066]MCX2678371.1 NAD(P)/FAD-dependent oxidoreductase [Galbibacter sp. EGI 63066]
MEKNENFEVIIVGGSYAGLSAAMTLGRSLRNVLIIDSGKPCNRQTPHSHNFLTQDGKTPKEISTIAKQQVEQYNTVSFLKDVAIKGRKIPSGFKIKTETGKVFTAKKLIFATGVKDIMHSIKGFSDCWGISVIHCPYCHGYEHKAVKTAIIANGERAFHVAPLVNNLTNDLTILTNDRMDFEESQLKKLEKHNIAVIEKEISEIEHQNGYLKKIVFKDGSKENFLAAYALIPFEQHTSIPIEIGCELTEQGHIKVDFLQQTTVDGIFACGDNSSPMRSVAYAVATGNIAGAMVNKELSDEQF